LSNSELEIKGNGKEDNHPKFHPPLADEIHPSNGGEFFQLSSAIGG
jgi:hypothetical protein